MWHLFFVDIYGCAYEWEVAARDEAHARSIHAGYDWSGVGDAETIIYLRVVEV